MPDYIISQDLLKVLAVGSVVVWCAWNGVKYIISLYKSKTEK